MERAKFQVWPNNAGIAAIAAKANEKIANDTAITEFKKTLQWVSTQMDRPVSLKLDKYVTYRKELMVNMRINDNMIKLKDSMQVTLLKADYNKFYKHLKSN